MSHRKLTEGCLFAMRSIADDSIVFNRTVASNLLVVRDIFPEFITITPPGTAHDRGMARPFFVATLTARGLAHITPRKLTRKAMTQCEARP